MKTCGSKGPDNFSYKHGLSNSPTYNTWHLMIQRCHNENAPDFKRYGGRGIFVCKRWRASFLNFLNDMGQRPHGMTLDRIDNSLGYYLENCRWATKRQQHRNTRQNRMLVYNGAIKSMCEWCEELGLNYRAVKQRIRRGVSVKDAFERPLRITKRTPERWATSHQLSF